MLRYFVAICALSLVMCAAVRAAQPDVSSQAGAESYSHTLYQRYIDGNYAAYAELLPSRFLPYVSPKSYSDVLALLARKLGEMGKLSFVSTFRQPGVTVLLWKAEYKAADGNNYDCLLTTSFFRRKR